MPYPYTFRPTGKVDVYDPLGTTLESDIDAQQFKPLIGFETNGFTLAGFGKLDMGIQVLTRWMFRTAAVLPLGQQAIEDAGGMAIIFLKPLPGWRGEVFYIIDGMRFDDGFLYCWAIRSPGSTPTTLPV
jgi:hypothetical protein